MMYRHEETTATPTPPFLILLAMIEELSKNGGAHPVSPARNGLNLGPAKKSKVETTTAPMPKLMTTDK